MLTITGSSRILSNLELKRTVAVAWQQLHLNDLVEALLYTKYYFQTGQASNELMTVLTSFFSWHVFHVNDHLELVNYYSFSSDDVSEIQNFVCSFLLLVEKSIV